jgi:RHS repeat-associated protein
MVSPSDPRLGGACQLEYAPVPPTGEKQAGRSYHYTEFGDVEQVTDCADGSSFVTNYGYDGFGRQKLLYYPTVNGKRLTVSYAYTGTGYLRQVADESTGAALWTAMSMNAAGQVTDEVLGNGVETQSVVNDATGWLLGRTSTAETDGNAVIQEWGYTFDEMGNLRARKRTDAAGVLAASETFGYDAVDRLTGANVQVPAQGYDPQSYVYDDQGNLQSKAGKTYHYGTGCLAGTRTAGPHAVCQIDDGPTYSYDGNGNLKGVGERAVRWNAANKAIRLTSGTGSSTKTADFIYGADGARVVQAVGVGDGELGSSNNSTQSRTVYVGLGATGKSIYERTKHGTITEHSHFIYAGSAHGGSAFAIRVIKQDTSSSATTSKAEYHHFDHLGSVVAATDDSGKVTSAVWSGSSGSVVGYDAWGAVHMPSGQTGGPTTYATPAGNRGFTDQEAIPSLGLVNMNGRIYDPIVGRFLSPDPNVQFASDLQSYNRYSYVTNNPLRYTDPTGYYVYQHSAWKEGLGTFVQMMGALAVVVVCAATDGAGCVPAAAAFSVLTTTAAIATGTPWDRAVAVGAISFALSAVGGSGISAAAKAGEVAWAIGDAAAMGAAISGVYALANGDAFGKGAKSMLEAAAISAATTAFAIAVSRGNPVSQAAAAEQGDGTMEARAGKGTVRAVPRDQTYGTAVKGGPPTAAELAENPRVKAALQVAYDHTNAGVPKLAHEEGGWIYWNPETRDTKVFPGPPGPAGTGSKGYFEIDLTKPKILKDYIVVGTYHAHPLLASEMAGHGGHWPPGPSWADKDVAGQQRVPGLVSDPTGVYLYGVVQRHGIDNGAGFPNWRLGQ